MSADIPAGALLGVDFGAVRIGVAACGPERILAFPLDTVPASDVALNRLVDLAEQAQAVAIIVGWPLALDGSAATAAQRVEAEAAALARLAPQPVWLVDERLTTAEAAKKLRQAGKNTRRARAVIDGGAAVGILETTIRALAAGQSLGWRVGG